MDTTALATTFPFTSSELTANEGVLYGINEHNGSLVIFDRFSLENANSVVFAKSGAGKSYMVKLEALRSLLFGTEVIIIDPENEYKNLASTIGGEYIKFAQNQPVKINPFDLSGVYEEGENELGLKILTLHSLFRVMLGDLTPTEDAILDRALITTYKLAGITPDPATQTKEPPLLGDLYNVLQNMAEPSARSMAARLEKFIRGSLSGVFDQPSTLDIRNSFTVFSIAEMQDELRPIAMFIILDFIWTRIKQDRKKRLLVVDEAWYLMKYQDSASFMYSIAKRARKYNLGLTTITQDVEDFLSTDYGKAIVTNSSIQTLLKQSTAAIDKVTATFYLSEGEKNLLLSADVGEGLFFAGTNHVAIRVQASPEEHSLLTQHKEKGVKEPKSEKQEKSK
jgi:type IV secretory pathway VirB4 component